MNLTFRKLTKEDVLTLRAFSIKTYYDTFMNGNSERVMQAYLDEAFAAEKLTKELCNPDSMFLFLYADSILAGYLKVNRAPSQTDLNDPESLELERIYTAKEFQVELKSMTGGMGIFEMEFLEYRRCRQEGNG